MIYLKTKLIGETLSLIMDPFRKIKIQFKAIYTCEYFFCVCLSVFSLTVTFRRKAYKIELETSVNIKDVYIKL